MNISAIIHNCLKDLLKSLLPEDLQRRVALNFEASNIKPRLGGLRRLKNIHQKIAILVFVSLTLLGYQPALQFPPVRQTVTLAQEDQVQIISSDLMPQIKLPHPGYISTRFSNFHPGVDLATGLGMPIHPITDGVVQQVNFGFLGYGNHVIISHPKGFQSLYGHMGRIYAKVGQQVSSGDTIGTVGLTGFTSGPHTHLEIQKDGKYINPLTILPPIQDYPSEEYLKPFAGNTEKLTKTLKPDFH